MRKVSKLLALLLTLILALGMTAQAEGASMIDLFTSPDAEAKGMFRYWIPYSVESREPLERQMTDMYESGFGGVEIAFFPSGVAYDGSTYGWATEAWRTTMKNILEIASEFEDGFVVDFTITPRLAGIHQHHRPQR